MKQEESIDFHIRWAWHCIARLYNNMAEQYGLTVSIGQVLLNIDLKTGTPSTKLGPKMGMEPRSLTRTLKSMEDDGLIMRRPDKRDKRMVFIHLTELGKEKREMSKLAVIKLNEFLQERIPKAKLAAFFEVMTIINRTLGDETPAHIFEKH